MRSLHVVQRVWSRTHTVRVQPTRPVRPMVRSHEELRPVTRLV